jgi:hypothetical protein
MATSFQILSSSLFTNRPTSQHYTVSDTDGVVQ